MLNLNKNHIFKFMPFGVNALKSLIKNELWFGNPYNLNDPFESKFDFDFKGGEISKKQMEDYYKNKLNINDALIERIYKNNGNVNFFLNDIYEVIQKSIEEKFGICSFSKTYLDIKMWSHYADSHKGICLIFDKEILFDSLKNANHNILESDIIYSEFLPSVEISFENGDVNIKNLERNKIVNTKLLDWADEKEIRYSIDFFNPQSSRSIPYNKEALKGIIFGEKTDLDNIHTLVHLLNLKNNNDFIWGKAFKNHLIGKMDANYINPKIHQPSNIVEF